MIRSFIVGVMIAAFSLPSYGYAGCFVGHRRKAIVVQQVFYPVYYQVGAGLREQAIADEAARKALAANNAQWEQRIGQLLRFRGEATLRFEGEAEAGATSGGGVDSPPPPAPAPGGGPPSDVLGIFATSCIRCHQPGKLSGGLDLTLPVTDPGTAAKIFLRAFSDEPGFKMPKDRDISDEDRQVIYEWAQTIH